MLAEGLSPRLRQVDSYADARGSFGPLRREMPEANVSRGKRDKSEARDVYAAVQFGRTSSVLCSLLPARGQVPAACFGGVPHERTTARADLRTKSACGCAGANKTMNPWPRGPKSQPRGTIGDVSAALPPSLVITD